MSSSASCGKLFLWLHSAPYLALFMCLIRELLQEKLIPDCLWYLSLPPSHLLPWHSLQAVSQWVSRLSGPGRAQTARVCSPGVDGRVPHLFTEGTQRLCYNTHCPVEIYYVISQLCSVLGVALSSTAINQPQLILLPESRLRADGEHALWPFESLHSACLSGFLLLHKIFDRFI